MGQKYRIHGLPDFSFSLKFTDGETMITRLITVTTKQQWDFLCRASGRVKGTNVKRFMSKYLTLIQSCDELDSQQNYLAQPFLFIQPIQSVHYI